ncbi:MAG: 16S rRNA (guanine(527)-N(7))-methyltransferase RsmG [Actinobacteria bacterium]|nr:16S rRNA (guanine(527)-N(7))-methyltransferase RsmG [Actinomycetota bacterium]
MASRDAPAQSSAGESGQPPGRAGDPSNDRSPDDPAANDRVDGAATAGHAREIFGPQLALAEAYAAALTGDGIAHGLLGPREAQRMWSRHLLNCAVVTELVPTGQRIVDVGTGAGLPGLAMACRRPDIHVDLVESLARRVRFLTETVRTLNLDNRVRIVRGRAEDGATVASVGGSELVTARAVAPLDRLVRWCLPLLRPGGRLLAIRGESAEGEAEEHRVDIQRGGGVVSDIVRCGVGLIPQPTVVVVVTNRRT